MSTAFVNGAKTVALEDGIEIGSTEFFGMFSNVYNIFLITSPIAYCVLWLFSRYLFCLLIQVMAKIINALNSY